ncbi:MAG TPA: aspartyl protease family protein [Myxococcota bacterium]|nr:aspartyl protease family protein [Myxococcota bacterium]
MIWRSAALSMGFVLATSALAAGSPETATSSTGSADDAVLGELPFLPGDEPNRILIDLAPGGYRPFRMMVDTGATDSVLTPGYARKLGVNIRTVQDRPYQQATRLGRDLQFWVDVRGSDTGSKTGFEYGLLGGTFLRDYVVELDFGRRRVRFLDPGRYQVPETFENENEASIPIKVVANRPYFELSVGQSNLAVLLDTGAPLTGVLSGAAAQKVGLRSTALAGLRLGSVVGPVEVEFSEAESLRLGPFDLTNVPLFVAPKGWYNIAGSTDSVVGYDVLAQFVVRIDYPRQRLWLQRRAGAEITFGGEPYARQRRAGVLVYAKSNGLAVAGLFPDSPAVRLGLRPGDVLVPAGGEKTEDFGAKVLQAVATGKEVTVARQINGAWVDLALPSSAGDSTSDEPKN